MTFLYKYYTTTSLSFIINTTYFYKTAQINYLESIQIRSLQVVHLNSAAEIKI